MTTRIFSPIGYALTAAVMITPMTAQAEGRPGYFTDPNTGIVYRQVTRNVERPVVETKMESREQTVFRPQTVRETRPQTNTYYAPVTEYQWEARLQGRWNPFRQPTVTYKQVPKTHWEPRSETINRTQTRTEWVAEKRTVEVPHRYVRMEREQKVEYEAVGRVAPNGAAPNGPSEAIAKRLQPLASNTQIQPINRVATLPTVNQHTQVGTTTLGRMTSDPPRRSASQGGMRGTELYPSVPTGYGRALPPANSGMATLPGFSLWR